MKKLTLIATVLFAFSFAKAQNIFPSNGNVGIGTNTPNFKLEIQNGNEVVNYDLLSGLGGQITISNNYGNQNGAVRLNLNNGGAVSWIKGIVTGANNNSGSAMVFGVPSINTDGTEVMRISSNGSLGIGTTTPSSKLHVENGNALINNDALSGLGGQITISNNYGNQNGAVRLNLNNGGAVSWIKGIVTGANTNSGSAMIFGVPSATSDGTEMMRIMGGGNVGIGTTNPDQKLSVAGTIHAQAVKVDMTGWNDAVFDKQYKLASLREVESYVGKNHHLSELPSEAAVLKNGIDLGEINANLLKKVEELTLYLIEKR